MFGIEKKESMPLVGNLDRNSLAILFFELGYKVGAEIGVLYGVNSEVLLKANQGLKLFCVDPWIPYGNRKINIIRKRFRSTMKLLAPYNVQYIRKMSMDALSDIADNSLDFVYIDANHHYSFVKEDIIEWSKKVRSGGIVSGHDYIYNSRCQVKLAVDEYAKANGIDPWYLTSEEILPSWFWVKP
jgi:predicted O-methyltransferase YrrM